MVSAFFLALILVAACVVPMVSPHDALHGSDAQFAPPGWGHWFGTDVHGRDLFTRVFAGTRVSLLVGAVGAAVSLVIGVCWAWSQAMSGGVSTD